MDHDRVERAMARMVDDDPRPQPLIHPDTEPFWRGLDDGELRVQICADCGTYRFPFAPVCFRCRSFAHRWEAISPGGQVAAAVEVHRATGSQEWARYVPYLSGNVDVEHELRLPGRILCTCRAAIRRGTRVRAVLLTSAGRPTIHAFAHACVLAETDPADPDHPG